MSHSKLIHLATVLMVLAVAVSVIAFSVAFVLDEYLSIPQQIAGHMGLLIGATLLKIGYVVRLNARRQQQICDL